MCTSRRTSFSSFSQTILAIKAFVNWLGWNLQIANGLIPVICCFHHIPIDRLNELLHCTTLGHPHLDGIGEGEIHVDHIEILVCRICYNLRKRRQQITL